MAGAGLFENPFEIIGNLDHRGIRVVGHGETDHQTRHLAVARDQAAGNVGGVQCDRFGPRQIGIFERLRVFDQRLYDEFVFARFAVGIIVERVTRVECGARHAASVSSWMAPSVWRVNTVPFRGATAIRAVLDAL